MRRVVVAELDAGRVDAHTSRSGRIRLQSRAIVATDIDNQVPFIQLDLS